MASYYILHVIAGMTVPFTGRGYSFQSVPGVPENSWDDFLSAYLFRLFPWSPWIFAILMLPMILDGVIQMITYESTNIRRFLTGFLFDMH